MNKESKEDKSLFLPEVYVLGWTSEKFRIVMSFGLDICNLTVIILADSEIPPS
jgi:hypothetical protein